MLHESSKENKDQNKISLQMSCACTLSLLSPSHMYALNSDMIRSFHCRSVVETVRMEQAHMENKGIVIFLVCVGFGFMAIVRSFSDVVVVHIMNVNSWSDCVSRKFCSEKSSWFYLFLSCSIIIIILSL